MRVVYLFGAGASQGAVQYQGSDSGILTKDLGRDLMTSVHQLLENDDQFHDPSIQRLVNQGVISEEVDFEHVITFLDESPSALHKRFAAKLRQIFERALKQRLVAIEEELQGEDPFFLYAAVIDMHTIEGLNEALAGILTINYDPYIEKAAESTGHEVDFGIKLPIGDGRVIPVLKLHGSFGWVSEWPIRLGDDGESLWIPPGVQKNKTEYPFNLLWGRARELLDCDILRIVGCHLGPNDWDLISLLFSSRTRAEPFRIQVINSLENAERLKREHQYLEVESIFEDQEIGPRLIAELLAGEQRTYDLLDEDDLQRLRELPPGRNWFYMWLKHMAEHQFEVHRGLETEHGILKKVMEETP